MIQLIIAGATGKMGICVCQEAQKAIDFKIIGVLTRSSDTAETWKVLQRESQTGFPTVLIDFTSPTACVENAQKASQYGFCFLSGTTGLNEEQREELHKQAQKIPLFYGSNFSLGANLLKSMSQKIAKAWPEAEVEILDLHHHNKKDAPSGTALMMGKAIADARTDFPSFQIRSGARHNSLEIGFPVIRAGQTMGEHTVYFFAENERLELTHRVYDRNIFAQGALQAARFLAKQAPGFYTIKELLDL